MPYTLRCTANSKRAAGWFWLTSWFTFNKFHISSIFHPTPPDTSSLTNPTRINTAYKPSLRRYRPQACPLQQEGKEPRSEINVRQDKNHPKRRQEKGEPNIQPQDQPIHLRWEAPLRTLANNHVHKTPCSAHQGLRMLCRLFLSILRKPHVKITMNAHLNALIS